MDEILSTLFMQVKIIHDEIVSKHYGIVIARPLKPFMLVNHNDALVLTDGYQFKLVLARPHAAFCLVREVNKDQEETLQFFGASHVSLEFFDTKQNCIYLHIAGFAKYDTWEVCDLSKFDFPERLNLTFCRFVEDAGDH